MKKTIILLFAAAVVFSACQKDSDYDNGAGPVSLTATVEQQSTPDATKTYLDGASVKWSEDDSIKVFYSGSNAYKFGLTTGSGTTTATFSYDDEVSGDPQYAIYPYSDGATISGSSITFTLPSVQTYAANTFANGANVAIAQVSGSTMQFKNVCGVLKISLTGYGMVDHIVLAGKNNEKLNGSFTVDASSLTPSAASTTASKDSEKTITLDCSASPVNLSETATDFYFVVPVGAFSTSGFTANAFGPNNTQLNVTLTGSNANVINRSSVRVMPEKEVKGYVLPSGYTTLEYIEANADTTGYNKALAKYAYIDCGCHFLFGDHFIFTFSKVKLLTTEDKGYGSGSTLTEHNITGGGRYSSNVPTYLNNYVHGKNYTFSPAVPVASSYGITLTEEWTMTEGQIDFTLTGDAIQSSVTASSSYLTSGFDSGNNIYIFRDNSTINPYPSNTRLYYTALQRQDGTYAFIFQPALRTSDNKPGVYDLVSRTFFVNQGTGADFTYPTGE